MELADKICELAQPANAEGYRRYLATLSTWQLEQKLADLRADQERGPSRGGYAGISYLRRKTGQPNNRLNQTF